jgi:predicted ATPase
MTSQSIVLDSDFRPSELELEQLARRATEVIERQRTLECAPVVIEFAGSPKSGKSTTIDVISHFFRRMDFKVRAPTEGASKRTPYHLKRNLVAFNCYTLNYAISELLDAYFNIDQPDLVILDRGPFDSIAWLKHLHDDGQLDREDLEALEKFARLPLWTSRMSAIYLFTCTPGVSLERENESKLTRREGRAMNPEMLAAMCDQYKALGENLEPHPVTPVDTTETSSPIGTSFRIAENIIDLFEVRECREESDGR